MGKQRLKKMLLNKKPRISMKSFLAAMSVITLTLMAAFWVSDETWLYFQMFVLPQQENVEEEYLAAGYVNTLGSDSSGSGDDLPADYGAVGRRMMLVSSMDEGYCKEFLTIVREHCNWNMMPDAVKPIAGSKGELFPTLFTFLGTSIAESGFNTASNSPYTLMNYSKYGTKDYFTLSQFNSPVVKTEGASSLSLDIDTDLKRGYYYTQLQFSQAYASIYPWATFKPTGSTKYPSKMSGYSAAAGRSQQEQTDAAYLPDQVAMVLQHGVQAVNEYFVPEMMTPSDLETIIYPSWNGGIGAAYTTWGVGARGDSAADWTPYNPKFPTKPSWHAKNTITKSDAAMEAVQYMSKIGDKILEYLCNNSFTEKETLWFNNHSDYDGLYATSVLLNGGFVNNQKSLDKLKSNIADGGFLRGALLAYKVFKDGNATAETVKTFYAGLSVTKTDENFYGPATLPKYNGTNVCVYSENLTCYNAEGQGPQKVLHCFDSEGTRGALMVRIAGPWAYWKMLLTSGVECSFADAVADGNGTQELLDDMGSGNPNDYYRGIKAFDNVYEKDLDVASRINSAMVYRTLSKSNGVHGGEDYKAPIGTRLVAIASGTVVSVGDGINQNRNGYGGMGNNIQVVCDKANKDDPTIYYRYFHLTKGIQVSVGDHITRGQYIGLSGNTGNSTGPHLHIEVHVLKPGSSIRYRQGYMALWEGVHSVASGPRYNRVGRELPCPVFNGNWQPIGSMSRTSKSDWKVSGYYKTGMYEFNWRLPAVGKKE